MNKPNTLIAFLRRFSMAALTVAGLFLLTMNLQAFDQDHSLFAQILDEFVDNKGQVDYRALKRNPLSVQNIQMVR